MRPKVRIGAVSYLNTRPLVHGLEQGLGADRLELSYDVPAGLGVAMAEGRLDIALLPVIELARIPDLEVVPGLGIGTCGAARSVLLIGKRPVTEMRNVALDRESRSSNALLQVLFAEVWRCGPRFGIGAADLEEALRQWDGVLRIGDKALFEPLPPGCHVYDLGQVWTEATGLPFLYAAWIARRGTVDREIYRLLHDSRRAGSRVIDRIAEEFNWNGIRDPQLARDYLTHNIRYRLGSPELQALRKFFEASHGLGLIDDVPQVRMALQRWTSCHETAAGAET